MQKSKEKETVKEKKKEKAMVYEKIKSLKKKRKKEIGFDPYDILFSKYQSIPKVKKWEKEVLNQS